MRVTKPQVPEHVNPNLIPMIDIMFLLLLFFMLGSDMGQRELEEVRLPKGEMVVVDPPGQAQGRITVNVYHGTKGQCPPYEDAKTCRDGGHWKTGVAGADYTAASLEAFLRGEVARTSAERKVMIRADAAAPYGLAQQALNACARAGLYQVQVGAAKRS